MRVVVLDGTILQIDASMPSVPMEECVEALKVVKDLEGVAIRPGFSDAVKHIVGSKWGCTHMASLIMNMGNVSVQGRAAYVRKKYGGTAGIAAHGGLYRGTGPLRQLRVLARGRPGGAALAGPAGGSDQGRGIRLGADLSTGPVLFGDVEALGYLAQFAAQDLSRGAGRQGIHDL